MVRVGLPLNATSSPDYAISGFSYMVCGMSSRSLDEEKNDEDLISNP